ncbi:hypothetical protein ACFOED_10050 [Vulcaniibacterium thermophilum]|jgi:hypothetical protein|uniref:Uncharacterized protein n=1 Tax=Vulcaniibacterium thermophilum TaxID=1169913 RepID=A0A918ZB57_9GAMM|nr:hypothetical protein [Vulcaniibacterium thermophilum]GHE43617.1 hypothetical protein GCM10007167_26730 [Vulcaniibacterium thermophilum]
MNARIEAPVSTPTARSEAAVAPFQSAPREREREFGFGYGSSSGYGTRRRYTTAWGQARFRCA